MHSLVRENIKVVRQRQTGISVSYRNGRYQATWYSKQIRKTEAYITDMSNSIETAIAIAFFGTIAIGIAIAKAIFQLLLLLLILLREISNYCYCYWYC